jgi:hypothetical protein
MQSRLLLEQLRRELDIQKGIAVACTTKHISIIPQETVR